jgi:uncharacterized integral membrane protein (TIGR00698 family)
MIPKAAFLLGLALAASGLVSPPVALALGLLFGFTFPHPFDQSAKKLSRYLLQASVVGLGFGMNLHDVIRAGRSGFVYTLLGISFAMLAGMALGALLGMTKTPAFLISTGTAICGGSAIAAVGPIIGAGAEQMAVSLGTIFVLNSIALLIFPAIGSVMKLTQTQFGLWAALAIHDTSSVVGAAAKYGAVALAVGTTVKLARALWIVPMSIATAIIKHSRAKIQWPWFIALFCLAAVCNTYLPAGAARYAVGSDVYGAVENRSDWSYRHSLPDRKRHFHRHPEKSWTPPLAAGSNPMAPDFSRFAMADPRRPDRIMKRFS